MGSSSAPAAPAGPSSVWSTTTSDPWVMQQPYLNYAMRNSADLWSTTPGEYYPGQTFAPMNPMQAQALQDRTQVASETMPGYVDQAQGAWQNSLNAPNLASNPYIQPYIDSATNRVYQDFENRVMPAIGDAFQGANQVGGSRQGVAEGLASQAAMQQAGDMSAQMMSGAYGQGLDAQARGLAFSPQMAGLGFMPSDTLAGVGDSLRAEQQRYYDDEMARWNFRNQEPYTRLQAFGIPTAQSWGTTGMSTSGSIPYQGGGGGGGGGFSPAGAVGGALTAGSALEAAGMASIANPYFAPLMIGGTALGGLL